MRTGYDVRFTATFREAKSVTFNCNKKSSQIWLNYRGWNLIYDQDKDKTIVTANINYFAKYMTKFPSFMDIKFNRTSNVMYMDKNGPIYKSKLVGNLSMNINDICTNITYSLDVNDYINGENIINMVKHGRFFYKEWSKYVRNVIKRDSIKAFTDQQVNDMYEDFIVKFDALELNLTKIDIDIDDELEETNLLCDVQDF